MHLPEAAQQLQRDVRQRHQAIPVAFGVADVHAPAWGVDIANLQAQPFAEAQSQTIEREEKDPVADDVGGVEDAPAFLDGDDVGQALTLGGLDQAGGDPGLAQNMGVVKL